MPARPQYAQTDIPADAKIVPFRDSLALYWRQDGRPVRRSLGTNDPAEAAALVLTIRKAEQTAKAINYTVKDLWELYRQYLGERPAAVAMSYEAKTIIPHFGHLLPGEVDAPIATKNRDIAGKLIMTSHCQTYIEKRRAQGRADGTVLTELNRLSCAFGYAAGDGRRWIDRKPEMTFPAAPEPRDRYLTRDEAWRILEVARFPHIRLAVILLLATGARVRAVLTLTWDRVDLDRRLIYLRVPGSSFHMKGRAICPMNDMAFAALTEAKAVASSIGAAQTDHVITWAGDRIGSIKKGIAAIAKLAKVEDVSPHVFRHTAGVWMAEDGVDMEIISQMLGHKNADVTRKVYARFSPTFLQGAAKALNLSREGLQVQLNTNRGH